MQSQRSWRSFYAVRFGQGVTLSRDAAPATTLAGIPVLFTVVALLD